MAAGSPLLQMERVNKWFGDLHVLQDVDLEVDQGEVVVVVGPSGSGKSTLCRTINRLEPIDGGTIRLEGRPLPSEGRELARLRSDVGMVFQQFNLFAHRSVLDNVTLGPTRVRGLPRQEAERRARELLARVGVENQANKLPAPLSGGQQQRVAIARALAHDPPLVRADEPTAHLDYIQVEGVLRLLRTLAEPGRIVVVATHDERLLPLADQIVHLSPSPSAASRPPERLRYRPGQVVFEQGAGSDLVYTVEEGEVEIVRQRTDGGVELLALLGPGRYFGELGPLFGLRRSATARAVGHAVLTGYTPGDFRELVGSGVGLPPARWARTPPCPEGPDGAK